VAEVDRVLKANESMDFAAESDRTIKAQRPSSENLE